MGERAELDIGGAEFDAHATQRQGREKDFAARVHFGENGVEAEATQRDHGLVPGVNFGQLCAAEEEPVYEGIADRGVEWLARRMAIEMAIGPVDEEGDYEVEDNLGGSGDVDNFLVSLYARFNIPIAVLHRITQHMNNHPQAWSSRLLGNERMPHPKTLIRRAGKCDPAVYIEVATLDPSGAEVMLDRYTEYPLKFIAERRLDVQYKLFYTDFEDVLRYHHGLHRSGTECYECDLSLDGVPECKSNGISLLIMSVQFTDCKNVYPVGILHAARRGMQLDRKICLRRFVESANKLKVRVRHAIADAPERAKLIGMHMHSGNVCCQFCLGRKVNKHFPSSSMGAPTRTADVMENLVQKIESGKVKPGQDGSYGVLRRSVLSGLDGFDIIEHVPTDYMHMVSLGITKQMIRHMFRFPLKRLGNVRVPHVDRFNELLAETHGLSEMSRRPRQLDLSVWKSEELKYLLLGYWPCVADATDRHYVRVWLLFTYLVRAFTIPDEYYLPLTDAVDLEGLLGAWYKEFEKAFGPDELHYNVHSFHHLMRVRALGPLTETSAYRFEDQYGVMKRAFVPGTPSTGKQALKKCFLSLRFGKHHCRKKLHLHARHTSAVDDRWIFLGPKNVLRATGFNGRHVTGHQVKIQHGCHLGGDFSLDFNDVLVYRVLAVDESRLVTYDISDIQGKCVLTGDILSVLTTNILTE